ncbi:hypothetical protein GLOIN_2v1724616 [Rhizophagus irregularis DAOM 181602=DAOM 197198]|uniref:Uncharacterized protein n=1 Tax=Rhizophagus irregularis (strain DAOM 181602 / DAOM 197198 / MUCL 43194) TaxID=747089 RepID=A0A2P4P174_RHIID|nr:hypothetical protein GLOIN_2v1724616 [Rhizophagus irregularis DAOM 181602=DAOM 197198]POG59145.1 hypothetical protein GLOIN_2v1724616 [Rhizophagus irregularis DAOM 181602=DAOM 197198]|eukprot:XP_025166011.1 hypothetical protein GLOIN_2v1724616 [Rhizophagus irregularis DAOM 181602=DAOM 197198]
MCPMCPRALVQCHVLSHICMFKHALFTPFTLIKKKHYLIYNTNKFLLLFWFSTKVLRIINKEGK